MKKCKDKIVTSARKKPAWRGGKQHGGLNAVITESQFKGELKRLHDGIDLLAESRRHGG